MACLGVKTAWLARSSGLRSGSEGKESQVKSSDKWREEIIRWDFLVPMLPEKVCFTAREETAKNELQRVKINASYSCDTDTRMKDDTEA